jgi:mycothiol synthase
MNSSNWHIRAFKLEDIPAIAALFDAADRADHLYKLSSEEDIRETFGVPDADPQSRVIVAEGPSQSGTAQRTLLGIGKVSSTFRSSDHERIYNVLLRVHPSARQQGLQHDIARRLIELARADESNPRSEHTERVRVLSYVFDSQASSIDAWERLGLRRVRTGWTMMRSLEAPIEVGAAPDAVNFRTYRNPEDNAQALQALNSAFSAYYDFYPLSEASWERQMGAWYSRPDLSWLAFSDGASDGPVGLAVCWVNESENRQTGRLEGWIEGIGVVPDFRQRGIGKALLTRCLHSLHSAGLETALADVDSESTAAVRLFQSAGFSVRSTLLQYECLLDENKALKDDGRPYVLRRPSSVVQTLLPAYFFLMVTV